MVVKLCLAAALMLCTNVLVNSEGFEARDILRRIEELEEHDRRQQTELETLRKQNMVMENEISQLKDRDVQQTRRIEVLEDNERAMKEVISFLMNGVQRTAGVKSEPQSDDLNDQSTSTNNQQQNDEGKAKTSKAHNRIRQVEESIPIAFFASLTSHAQHLGHNQPIVFDNSITNIGQAYHSSSGVFTAPVSGVYVFSATLMSYHETAHFQYAVNGKVMTKMYVHASDTYETTCMTAIFNLTQGDDVAVQNADSDKFVHGDHYSSLSGFLLYPTTENLQTVVG